MNYYVDYIGKDCFYISLGNKGLGFATEGETIMLCCAFNSSGYVAGNDWLKELNT